MAVKSDNGLTPGSGSRRLAQANPTVRLQWDLPTLALGNIQFFRVNSLGLVGEGALKEWTGKELPLDIYAVGLSKDGATTYFELDTGLPVKAGATYTAELVSVLYAPEGGESTPGDAAATA